jgi:repressor LexA
MTIRAEDIPPTERQLAIRAFILDWQQEHGATPSFRDIQQGFGLKSVSGVVKHVQSLLKKGLLRRNGPHYEPGYGKFDAIPLLGSIPAGMPSSREEAFDGEALIDLESFGIRRTQRTFRVVARGDSMVGAGILDGDTIICEQREPRTGDVVAALIDGQCTLKTYLLERGKPFLRAENPKYPRLIPAEELVIQGVMKGLVRVQH